MEEELEAAIFEITKNAAAWEIVQKALDAEIYSIQANALEAKTWEQLVEARGFARGIAYMRNIRDVAILSKKRREDPEFSDAL